MIVENGLESKQEALRRFLDSLILGGPSVEKAMVFLPLESAIKAELQKLRKWAAQSSVEQAVPGFRRVPNLGPRRYAVPPSEVESLAVSCGITVDQIYELVSPKKLDTLIGSHRVTPITVRHQNGWRLVREAEQ